MGSTVSKSKAKEEEPVNASSRKFQAAPSTGTTLVTLLAGIRVLDVAMYLVASDVVSLANSCAQLNDHIRHCSNLWRYLLQLKMGNNFSTVPAPPKLDDYKTAINSTPGWQQVLTHIPADLARRVEFTRKLEELRANWWKKCFKDTTLLNQITIDFAHDFRNEYRPRYLQRGVSLETEIDGIYKNHLVCFGGMCQKYVYDTLILMRIDDPSAFNLEHLHATNMEHAPPPLCSVTMNEVTPVGHQKTNSYPRSAERFMVVFAGAKSAYGQFCHQMFALRFNCKTKVATWLETVQKTPLPDPRWGHTAAPWRGGLIVFGGSAPGRIFSDVWLLRFRLVVQSAGYAPAVEVRSDQLEQSGDVPSPRCGHVCTAVGESFYVFGGAPPVEQSGYSNAQILKLDIVDDGYSSTPKAVWTALKIDDDIDGTIVGAAGACVGNRIFYIGGRSRKENSDSPRTTVQRIGQKPLEARGVFQDGLITMNGIRVFDLGTQQFVKDLKMVTQVSSKQRANKKHPPLWERHTGHIAVPCRGGLIMFGGMGRDGTMNSEIYRLNIFDHGEK